MPHATRKATVSSSPAAPDCQDAYQHELPLRLTEWTVCTLEGLHELVKQILYCMLAQITISHGYGMQWHQSMPAGEPSDTQAPCFMQVGTDCCSPPASQQERGGAPCTGR